MKKTFSIICAAALISASIPAAAQLNGSIGYLNQNTGITSGNTIENSIMNGMFAGVGYTFALGSFGITPGVYYSYLTQETNGKGSASVFGIAISGNASARIDEQYINVPLRLSYGVDLGPDVRGFIYAGPMFSYGLASTTKSEGGVSIGGFSFDSGEKKYDNYSDDSYSKTNFTVGGGIGITIWDSFRFSAGYDYGLKNRYTGNADISRRTNLINVTAAYCF